MHSRNLLLVLLSAMIAACFFGCDLSDETDAVKQSVPVDRVPAISPDYSQMVIPPNIAPLNFIVREDGSKYYMKIYSKYGTPIEIFSKKPAMIIPQKPWQELLNSSKGHELFFDIFIKNENGRWMGFIPIKNKIANETIDDYLVYRKIPPVHRRYRNIGVFQRKLQNYEETPLLKNERFKRGCLNCHTFCANKPDKFLLSIRSPLYGDSVLLVDDDRATKIDTKFGYTSWHPSGKLVAYSVNKVQQFIHSIGDEPRDVFELDSLLVYYLIDSKTVKTTPALSRKDRLETYPSWSPDGRYLYYCSAPVLWLDDIEKAIPLYDKVKYDLMRISYDIDSDKWGQPQTILAGEDTGLSILEPRISPDGRWLLFVMCHHGCFPVYRPGSDLYLIDLKAAEKTGRFIYKRLDINSNESESWHSFSSNSRWIAFSSKRRNGTITRVYLSYIDKDGKVHKPVLLPQKNPEFYDSCLDTYSVPEFITDPVTITGEKLGRVVRGSEKINVTMPITMATPRKDAEPYREGPMYGEQR